MSGLSLDSLVDTCCEALQQEGEQVEVAIMLPGEDGYTTFLFDVEATLLRVTEGDDKRKVVFAIRPIERAEDSVQYLI